MQISSIHFLPFLFVPPIKHHMNKTPGIQFTLKLRTVVPSLTETGNTMWTFSYIVNLIVNCFFDSQRIKLEMFKQCPRCSLTTFVLFIVRRVLVQFKLSSD